MFLTSLRRWFQGSLAALGVLILIVTFTPVDFWWATALAGPWDDPPGDVMIVLTGSGLEDGVIGMSSYWRAVYALRFYKAEKFQELLITGGDADAPIAASMRDFVVAQGVPAEAVRLESESRNTHDSARNTSRLLTAEPSRYKDRRLVLLTSDFHMYRAHRAFENAGVRVAPRPIPDVRKRYSSIQDRWSLFLELALESVKIGYYWTRGWI